MFKGNGIKIHIESFEKFWNGFEIQKGFKERFPSFD